MIKDYRPEVQGLLRKLFQFDSEDLDFGIYRIMNYKHDEIRKFIEEDLINIIDAEFEKSSVASLNEVDRHLQEIKKKILSILGEDAILPSGDLKEMYRSSPIAKEYYTRREELKSSEMTDEHKAEIFSHIYQFFSRYYDEGDFISLRRYSKQNKYAIPYNGEEVKLHWANRDQYYIKTGEYFKNYSFKIGDYSIRFRLIDAETDQNNNRSGNRIFLLKDDPNNVAYDENLNELSIFFEYRTLAEDEKEKHGTRDFQKYILVDANELIISRIKHDGLKSALQKQEGERTLLEKHLFSYTKRNTTDYFIHKDLKVFLSGELDFYIKNEVLNIDDLGQEGDTGIESHINRVRVIKAISLKIIDFLAQIEEFQKKLFEKKKFVIKSDYCITLNQVPVEFYADIARNASQLKAWKDLFGIDRDTQTTLISGPVINEDFLKSHPFLVLDTKFFSQDFKDRLLSTFEDLDDATEGVMVRSENWQALNLLECKYLNQIKGIYIDPPYNTGNDEFIYKDHYQDSSWLSMMWDRLEKSKKFLQNDGSLFVSIGEEEQHNLKIILTEIFGWENYAASIVWQKSKKGDAKLIAEIHEYILAVTKDKTNAIESGVWRLPKTGVDEVLRYYDLIRIKFKNNHDSISAGMKEWYSSLPINDPRRAHQHYHFSDERGLYFAADFSGPDDGRNSRPRYDIIHPVTRKPCKKPSTGWRWDEKRTKEALALYPSLIHFGKDETTIPCRKTYLSDTTGEPFMSVFYRDGRAGTLELEQIMGKHLMDFPKNTDIIENIIQILGNKSGYIMDFFAGSGTTGHAVLNLNKKDSGRRKYILVEMADYFDAVMKTRIQKVMYSREWQNGSPSSNEGINHIFKYMYLEQYEDTLDNIEFFESGTVQRTLEELDGYFLRYMLDFETRDSPCRLNVDRLNRPFDYTLKITRNNEMRDEKVDLVETFNYLLGLHVKRIKAFCNNETCYKVVQGKKEDETVTIVWRTTDGLNLEEDKSFIEGQILKDFKAKKVYINGDFFVEGAISIEPEFKRLMGA